MATVLDLFDEQASDELAHLPEHYELVNGEVVELPTMSDYAGHVSNRLNRELARYLIGNDIGECGVELLYRIPLPEDRSRNRRPDVSFVSYDRWPRSKPLPFTGNARDVVPDLVVEVVSPGDSADDLIAKAREYLRGGVRMVLLVYPLAQEIHAYWPNSQEVRVYFAADELEAGDILPGFRTLVGPLFPPREPPPPQPEPAA